MCGMDISHHRVGFQSGENEDDWEFAPVQEQTPSLSPEDHNKAVQKLVDNWLESIGPTNTEMVASTEMVPSNDESLVTDWDSWLQSANIPEEAQELVTKGISSDKVPVVPFAKLGVKAESQSTTFGGKVRENFWTTLGKHLQLPLARPAPSSPGRASGGAHTEVQGASETETTLTTGHNQSAEPDTAGSAMVDADWGLLETVAWLHADTVE